MAKKTLTQKHDELREKCGTMNALVLSLLADKKQRDREKMQDQCSHRKIEICIYSDGDSSSNATCVRCGKVMSRKWNAVWKGKRRRLRFTKRLWQGYTDK